MKENEMNDWLTFLGLAAKQDGWTMELTMSTVPIDNWFFSRNKLKPEDIKIRLIAPSWGRWLVQLERHDQLFLAQWYEDYFTVDSEQIKYRKLIQWPALEGIYDFPKLIAPIEAALNIEIIKHIDVGARFIDLKPHLNSRSKLYEWLKDCSDTMGIHLQRDKVKWS
ncbi:hypothetical protein OAE12_00495 [bacterium]|nr:hypothetical protein [bacterium]